MYHLNILAGTPTQRRSITFLTDRIANVSNNPKFIVIIDDTSSLCPATMNNASSSKKKAITSREKQER